VMFFIIADLIPKLRSNFAEFLTETYTNAFIYSTRAPVSD